MQSHLLSILIWLPIISGVLVLGTGGDERAPIARKMALAFSIIIFLLSLPLYTGFDATTAAMQFTEHASWISSFNVFYSLGVDGISMPLILLTTLLTIIVVIAGWQVITERVAQYMAAFLIMEGIMIGVFASLDAVLFYVFWEAMLIPMFLVIGIWGGPNRIYATIKFFLYTLLGSLLMLVAFLYLYNLSGGSFSILEYHTLKISQNAQILIFLAFFAAFAVKVPMFPVHTWLPDAHVEAPTGGSVILAAIMLKMGGYGFIRFNMPITPDASHELAWLMITSVVDRRGLYRVDCSGTTGHEEADCLFLDLPYGICHSWTVYVQQPGSRGRDDANDFPWFHFRRSVPLCRCIV